MVHWDGQLLPDIEHGGLVDRLPILLTDTSDGSMKLRSTLKVYSGTGINAANAIMNQLTSWVSPRILSVCVLTPPLQNTGVHSGACVLLEHLLERLLLWLHAAITCLKFYCQMPLLYVLGHQVDQR